MVQRTPDKDKAERNTEDNIKKTVYLPYGMDVAGYPVRINIEFENGKTITYKRE